jgi:hypothetical protein
LFVYKNNRQRITGHWTNLYLTYKGVLNKIIKMKIPNFLQKKSADIWYWVKLRDNTGKVNKNDFFGVMTIPRIQRKLRGLYDSDPNNMDPQEVSMIFSQVLSSMDSWKNSLGSA